MTPRFSGNGAWGFLRVGWGLPSGVCFHFPGVAYGNTPLAWNFRAITLPRKFELMGRGCLTGIERKNKETDQAMQ